MALFPDLADLFTVSHGACDFRPCHHPSCNTEPTHSRPKQTCGYAIAAYSCSITVAHRYLKAYSMVASNDSSSRLAVPLTFSNGNDVENHSIASLGEGSSKATVITSWGLSDSCSGSERFAVVGCQDGTTFVFRPSLVPSTSAVSKPHDSAQSSRPSSPLRVSRDSRATSRSTSPTSNTSTFPPFNVTPRSRIVSGITTEQVEAPKNYVDFEDEPDKLKDMLKARRSKDRRNSSELRDSTSNLRHAPTLSPEAAFSPAKQRKEKPRSLLSAHHFSRIYSQICFDTGLTERSASDRTWFKA